MYIGYDSKNGVKYAKICSSSRVDGKVITRQKSLGKVLDEEKGIYQNRKLGIFTYDIETDTYGKPDASFVPEPTKRKNHREKLILDFGDTFFLDSYINQKELRSCINAIGYGNPDTLYAMIHYYVLCNFAVSHAAIWYEGSYVSELYPKANLSSQRISDFLASIGDEYSQRKFFTEYLKLAATRKDGTDILIDSTGLPNSIHFPLTAVTNHNGTISNEVRLIYVLQQETNLPLYFRYCPGNVIDVSTLTTTMLELKAYNINTKFAILDAGYLDNENMEILYKEKVSFLSRMKENRKLYKQLVAEHIPSIETEENMVRYNSRYAYIKRVECEVIEGHKAYAYVCQDIAMKGFSTNKLFARASVKNLGVKEVHDELQKKGVFVLFSSRPIAKDKILPTYYARQQIEQIFDIGKNYANMLPLRVHTEETFRGHLMLTFISSVLVKMFQDELKDSVFNPISAFLQLRNQKCKVFDKDIIPQEAVKKVNDIYKKFKLSYPKSILRKAGIRL
jgi:hypothetical protein